jgi:vacuolar-type H+-ATPase subunit E/Vma4
MTKEPTKLEERILEDGRKKADPVKRRAQRKADKIVQDAKEEAEKRREQMIREAEEEAEQELQRTLARAELEAENVRRRAREAVLQEARRIACDKLQQLAKSGDHIESIALLAVQSLQAMRGEQFELVVAEREKQARGEQILEAVTERADEQLDREFNIRLAAETLSGTGGLIVRRSDGEEICDQTFPARIQRLWPQIRTEIATDLLENVEQQPGNQTDEKQNEQQDAGE